MLDALIPAQQAFSDAAHLGLSSLHLTCHESMHEEQRTQEHHTAGLSETHVNHHSANAVMYSRHALHCHIKLL